MHCTVDMSVQYEFNLSCGLYVTIEHQCVILVHNSECEFPTNKI